MTYGSPRMMKMQMDASRVALFSSKGKTTEKEFAELRGQLQMHSISSTHTGHLSRITRIGVLRTIEICDVINDTLIEILYGDRKFAT